MSIDKNELTKEQVMKALQCKSVEELQALPKEEGVSITAEEAEAYLAELSDLELDSEKLKNVAGGRDVCYTNGCALKCVNNL